MKHPSYMTPKDKKKLTLSILCLIGYLCASIGMYWIIISTAGLPVAMMVVTVSLFRAYLINVGQPLAKELHKKYNEIQ